LGPLAKWVSPLNPGFADLVAIELGRTALAVDSLEVRLTPEGDRLGRSARVLVNARPEIAGTSVGPVTFEVGVKGPLAYVLRIGAENGATLKLRVRKLSLRRRVPCGNSSPCFRSIPLLAGLLLTSGCINVKVQPIEVKVQATLDVNVKVDRALDDFFGDLDQKSATIGTAPTKR